MDDPSHRTLVTVSGLLAGFSFTAAIGLLRVPSGTKAYEVAFISFLLATFLFMTTLFGGWTAIEWLDSGYPASVLEKKKFYVATYPLFMSALLAFAVGVSATALLHSLLSGIIASLAALGALIYFCVAGIGLANANANFK
jgi:hypothetical protein